MEMLGIGRRHSYSFVALATLVFLPCAVPGAAFAGKAPHWEPLCEPGSGGAITSLSANPTPPNENGSTIIETQVYGPGEGRTAAPVYSGKPGTETGQQCVNSQDQAVMVWIPAGEFLMGRKDGSEDGDERPQRTVCLDGYWMYKNSVTVGQYRKFCAATKQAMPPEPSWKWQDDNPVVNVTWDDAVAYTKWAGMALPTEAQWEKVARGTDGRIYPWGNDWDASKCVNGFNSGHRTQPVGSIPADISPYGCLEMVGNVWQWCADWYYDCYYRVAPAKNPTGPVVGIRRVIRGGSWYFEDPYDYRTSYRAKGKPSDRIHSVRFGIMETHRRLAGREACKTAVNQMRNDRFHAPARKGSGGVAFSGSVAEYLSLHSWGGGGII